MGTAGPSASRTPAGVGAAWVLSLQARVENTQGEILAWSLLDPTQGAADGRAWMDGFLSV